jgi:hypothetical protein
MELVNHIHAEFEAHLLDIRSSLFGVNAVGSVDHSLLSSVDVKKAWSFTSTFCVFMALALLHDLGN